MHVYLPSAIWTGWTVVAGRASVATAKASDLFVVLLMNSKLSSLMALMSRVIASPGGGGAVPKVFLSTSVVGGLTLVLKSSPSLELTEVVGGGGASAFRWMNGWVGDGVVPPGSTLVELAFVVELEPTFAVAFAKGAQTMVNIQSRNRP